MRWRKSRRWNGGVMFVREFCSLGPSRADGFRAGGRWGAGRCPKQLDVASSHDCDRMCIGNGSRGAGCRFAMDVTFPLVAVQWKTPLLRSLGSPLRGMSNGSSSKMHHDWILTRFSKAWARVPSGAVAVELATQPWQSHLLLDISEEFTGS